MCLSRDLTWQIECRGQNGSPRCYLRFVLIRVGCAVVTARSASIAAVRANCAQGGSPGTERNQPRHEVSQPRLARKDTVTVLSAPPWPSGSVPSHSPG